MSKIQSKRSKHQQKNKAHQPLQRRIASSGNSNQRDFTYLQARMGYSAATQYIQTMMEGRQTSTVSTASEPQRSESHRQGTASSAYQKTNNTGLPDSLKSGIENLSGYSMDDTKVHYNSSKPAQLQAHAYTRGTDIYLRPGQEKHLPHEAWHVVQQKQGRVKPTTKMNDKVNVNDDAGLEKEADVMGYKALQMKPSMNIYPNKGIQRKSKNLAQVNSSIQMSRVITHHYRTLEPPIRTLIDYLVRWSGLNMAQVIADLNTPLTSQQVGALNDDLLDRPDRVVAILDGVVRGTRNPNVQTGLGHIGDLEDILRGRGPSDYNGGHLLMNSLGGFYDPITNSPRNIAPQSTTSNTYGGNWQKSERKIRELVWNGKTVFLDASYTYPDRTYTVPGWRMYSLVTPGSLTANNLSSVGKYLFTTFHTWTPSQSNISFTANRIGQADPDSSNRRITLSWNPIGKLTNPVTRQFFGTFLNSVQRFMPIRSLATTAYGPIGSDVVENQDHSYHGIMNETKQDLVDIAKIHLLMSLLAKYEIGASSVFAALAYIPGFSHFILALEFIGISQAAIVASPFLTAALLWVAAKQFSFIKRVLPNRVQYVLDLAGI